MSNPNTSEKSVYLDREEHVHKGELGAKRTVLYYYDAGTDTLIPINTDNPLPTEFSGSLEIANDTGNPVPINGTVTAQQTTHDNFNANANIQVGNSDVSGANPIPISGSVTAAGAELDIEEALTFTNYNLASAAYNATTAISTNYLASQIELHFSTRAKRTITLTTEDGTVWRTITDDVSLDRVVNLNDTAFNGGEQLTLNITQTASACTVTGKLVIKQGSISLGGDTPVLIKGQEFGSLDFDFLRLPQHAKDTANQYASLPVLDSQTFTADAGTDFLTSVAHGLSNGDIVVVGTAGTLPLPMNPVNADGIQKLTEYYVRNKTDDTFQISTSAAGAVLNLTDTGTGTHTWYKPTVFTGTWQKVDQSGGIMAFALDLGNISTGPLTTYQIQWSDDGTNLSSGLLNSSAITLRTETSSTGDFVVGLTKLNDFLGKYYRIRAVGGMSAGLYNLNAVIINPFPVQASIVTLKEQLSNLTAMMATRSVIMGLKPENSDGNQILGNVNINEDSALVTADFLLEVAKGNTPLHSMAEVQGYNADIDTGSTPEDISGAGGTYAGFPTAGVAETATIVSTSVNDTSAGTGARTVVLTGLDANWEEQTETLTLNGTTNVNGVLTWQRIRRVHVATAGSGGANAGTITCNHTTTTANVFASIAAGRNQSAGCVFTVPANKTAFMTDLGIIMNVAGGTSAAACLATVRVRADGGVFRARKIYNATASVPVVRSYASPITLTPKSDVKITIESVTDNNTQVSGEIALTLVETV